MNTRFKPFYSSHYNVTLCGINLTADRIVVFYSFRPPIRPPVRPPVLPSVLQLTVGSKLRMPNCNHTLWYTHNFCLLTHHIYHRLLSLACYSRQVTLLGLLDLIAAFDNVDHDIHLTRLQNSYGVIGTALAWIASFIKGRCQPVTFKGHQSAWEYYAPQGSVLGLLFFILYTSNVISIAAIQLEFTPASVTANFTSNAQPSTNQLLLLDWLNALKE